MRRVIAAALVDCVHLLGDFDIAPPQPCLLRAVPAAQYSKVDSKAYESVHPFPYLPPARQPRIVVIVYKVAWGANAYRRNPRQFLPATSRAFAVLRSATDCADSPSRLVCGYHRVVLLPNSHLLYTQSPFGASHVAAKTDLRQDRPSLGCHPKSREVLSGSSPPH